MKWTGHFIMVSLILAYAWYLEATHDLTLPICVHATIGEYRVLCYGLLTLFFVGRKFRKPSGRSKSCPKLALLAMSIPLQWYAFGLADSPSIWNFGAAIPINTFHAAAIQRLMWYHNRNHLCEPAVKARAGFQPSSIASDLYIAAGLVTILLHAITGAGLPCRNLGHSILGSELYHYFLDSKIWPRARKQRTGCALRL